MKTSKSDGPDKKYQAVAETRTFDVQNVVHAQLTG